MKENSKATSDIKEQRVSLLSTVKTGSNQMLLLWTYDSVAEGARKGKRRERENCLAGVVQEPLDG